MSWTETASLHIKDKNKCEYFEEMINKILFLFASIGLLMIAAIPFVYDFVIGNEYQEAYYYAPMLIFANAWSVFTWLCGGIYIAVKNTKKVMNTTLLSAFINLGINLLLIKRLGLHAACISTLVSYVAVSVIRYFDSQKYVKYKINVKYLIVSIMTYVVCMFLYYQRQTIGLIASAIIAVCVSIVLNKSYISLIINKIIKRK